jgi:hypothetical protein
VRVIGAGHAAAFEFSLISCQLVPSDCHVADLVVVCDSAAEPESVPVYGLSINPPKLVTVSAVTALSAAVLIVTYRLGNAAAFGRRAAPVAPAKLPTDRTVSVAVMVLAAVLLNLWLLAKEP